VLRKSGKNYIITRASFGYLKIFSDFVRYSTFS